MSEILEKINELPEGWDIVVIDDVAEVNPRANKSEIPDDLMISFVPMPAVEAETGGIDVSKERPFVEVKKGFTPFIEGDVLFAKITPCMENGKMSVVPKVRNGYGFGSTEFHVLRPREKIESKWLYYFVSSKQFRADAQHNMAGAVGQKRVPTIYLKQQSIPLAPHEQQKQIVAKIEQLFSHIDAGIEALNTAKQRLKQYRQSVLKAAVTGELTKEWRGKNKVSYESWNASTLGEISVVQTGKTPKRSTEKFWKGGTIPWLTSSATNEPFTHHADQFVTQAAVDAGLKLFEQGTLLLAMYGEGKTRGQVTEITFQAASNQACAAITVDEQKAMKEYVRLRLNENYEQTRKAASGGNQPNLNLSKVREISLPLPLLIEQSEIVLQVEKKLEFIKRLENDLDIQLFKAEKNKQSILVSAFSGRLVNG